MSKGMKIWYQSMTPLGRLPNYVKALQAHAAAVCSEGVEVHFKGLPEKWFARHMPGEIFKYVYAKHVIQNEVIDVCRAAQKDGYDAIILGSFAASFLTEIRAACSVPVTSMAESVLQVSGSLAESMAVVCLAPAQIPRVQQTLERHANMRRIRCVEALQQPLHEGTLDKVFAEPQPVVAEFEAVARRAVAAGCDAVIPAEGVLSELLFANGVRTVDGAAIVDVVGVGVLYTEMLVNLQRRAGLGVGRRWTYALPPDDIFSILDEARSR